MKEKTRNPKRWYVDFMPELDGWGVFKEGFKDSWYDIKKEAVDRCDQLNKEDENEL